jgi:hypothetical protein
MRSKGSRGHNLVEVEDWGAWTQGWRSALRFFRRQPLGCGRNFFEVLRVARGESIRGGVGVAEG